VLSHPPPNATTSLLSQARPDADADADTITTACPDQAVRERSLAKYRHKAAQYDSTVGPTWTIRERAVAALQLKPGQSVLDVGCGTGMSLSLLQAAVGDQGRVYGCDHSPDMLARARQQVLAAGWPNVQVVECPAQAVRLCEPVDALLFHYTHDILRSPAAIQRLLSLAKPGARVAIAGIKYFPRWMAPLNLWVYFKNHGYNGSPGQLSTPWDHIARHIDDWQWAPTQWGMGYLASGRLRVASAKAAAVADVGAQAALSMAATTAR
jgi:ubiquinone/menaquinone biosynthesis C-methylase UbiE